MITKWGVENFKSIRKADLDLAPLTVFTGTNCSGKSSFLQSIVMLVQAAKRGDIEIDLKGDLIDLGSFDRIYHRNSAEYEAHDSDKIGINCIIPSEMYEDVRLELGLSRGDDTTHLRTRELILECKNKDDKEPSLIKYIRKESVFEIRQEVKLNNNNNDKIEWAAKSEHIFDKKSFLPDNLCFLKTLHDVDIRKFIYLLFEFPAEKLVNKAEAQKYADKNLSCLKWDKRIIERLYAFIICILDSYTSREYVKSSGVPIPPDPGSEISYLKWFFNSYPYNDVADWYLALSGEDKTKAIFNSSNKELCKELNKKIEEENKEQSPDKLKDARDHLYDYFKSAIYYLGPLRLDHMPCIHIKEPEIRPGESIQAFNKREAEEDNKNIDVGVKGENTMSVIDYLHRRTYKIKNYFSPKFFEYPDYKPVKEKEFSEALAEWLISFDIAEKYRKIKSNSKLDNELDKRYEVVLVINGQEYSLTQLGTGVSHILPVLVMCLDAPVGSTLIIQEPEQNCHPKWQSLLADLFILTSLSGRKCLIETHSEYIIEKIRLRTVMLSDRIPLHEQTRIYFVSQHNRISEFKDIKMNEYAVLDEWPDDFFDETQLIIDKIFEEALKKKEAQEKNE